MSNLSKLKLGKFVVTIVAMSGISAIVSTAKQVEAFPAPTILQPGSSVKSNNQCFSLNAQADGNLVLYKQSNGQALWNTGTYGRNVKQTIFQTDGNLVIYNTGNQPVWASNTDRRGATQLNVQDDGNVVMYNAQNQAIWHTNTVTSCGSQTQPPRSPDTLIPNTTIPLGSSIKSNNQCFSLNAQSDGNLVLYRQSNGQALWSTGTYGRGVQKTTFQDDGNLVIYNTNNNSVWASGTDRRGATKMIVQNDGNFVMYNAQNQALWHTNTVTSCNAPIAIPSRNPNDNYLPWESGYSGRVDQAWGANTTGNRTHVSIPLALDFTIAEDRDVRTGNTWRSIVQARAIKGGVVEMASSKQFYGNTVIIKHNDGTKSQYSHLFNMSVSVGQQVSGGQNLGYVGQTGTEGRNGQSNVHLHFQIMNASNQLIRFEFKDSPGADFNIFGRSYTSQNR